MKFVFDTNIIISAMLRNNSIPQQAFYSSFRIGEVLISNETLDEILEVSSRKKFAKVFNTDVKNRLISLLKSGCKLVTISQSINKCRDDKDNKFLELAVCGKADFIISGDDDLLILNPFQNISILKPKSFLDMVKTKQEIDF